MHKVGAIKRAIKGPFTWLVGMWETEKKCLKNSFIKLLNDKCFGEDIEISKFLSLSLFLIFAPTWQSHERLAVIPSELGFANRAEPEVKETAEYVT